MPHLIFDKITGVPEKCLQDLTTPYSPALSFKRRKLRTMNNDEVLYMYMYVNFINNFNYNNKIV